MKKLTLSASIILFLTLYASSQTVNIPDTNFLNALITEGVDVNGDGLIQVVEAAAVSDLMIANRNISSLEGIQEFVGLKNLNCERNNLSSLDMGSNPLLESLVCRINYNLKSLNVKSNLLLRKLDCSYDSLMTLDVTDNPMLDTLFCEFNRLINLDVSSNPVLTRLICGSNSLTALNVTGNPLLEVLRFSYNRLTTIDISENPLLFNLSCGNNRFADIDVSENPLLKSLMCNKNQLTTLDLSNNPLITSLNCDENELTSLDLSAQPLLEYLFCEKNELIGLELNYNPLLKYLGCRNANLTTLDMSENPVLETLYCASNAMTSLNVTMCTRLKRLYCSSNSFTSLDLSNNPQLSELLLSFNDPIQYICANPENYQVIINRINQADLDETVVSLYCHFGVLVKYRPTAGLSSDPACNASFFDDQIELISAFNGDTISFVNTGFGNIYLPAGPGQITMWANSMDPALYAIIDSVYTLDSMTLSQGLDTMGVFHDTLCAVATIQAYDAVPTLMPIDVPRPGFEVTYKMKYENRGTEVVSGTIGLKYDGSVVTFIDSELMTDSHLGDSLTWSFEDLQPFEERSFTLDFLLNSPMDTPPLNDGDQLEYSVCMNPIIDDYHPEDNCYTLNQTGTTSFDPNEKQCLQGDRLIPDMVGSWLTYMIRFENTGSAEAITVRIQDKIDTDVFDVQSLTPVDASHPYHIEIHKDNQVHFVFPEINLPFDDDNNDGYITFRIRTLDDLLLGDSILNQASIFFDFNFPIETNVAVTEVKELDVSTLNVSHKIVSVQCSPNPASELVRISCFDRIEAVEVVDRVGQIVQQIVPLSQTTELNFSIKDLAAGGYLIKVKTAEGIAMTKLIVE